MTSLQQLNIESFKEGNRLEAKLAKGGVPASLWETYSSFANTDGGLILLGVKENKNHTFAIEGIDNPEQVEKAFWDGVNNKKVVNINLLNNNDVEITDVDGKRIIIIRVPRAERIYRPVYKGQDMFSGTYRRNGEGDYLCSRDEVAAIFRDAGQVTQDNKLIVEVNLDALCQETITHYRRRFMLVHQGHVWNNLSDVDFLKKIGAAKINREDGKVYPTAAGLLMFGYESEILYEYPLYFLDYQEHFDETTRWSDRVVSSSGEWSGNIFDFFFKVFNKLTEDIKRPFVLEGITRVDDTPVHKAIREILLNTLANADYYGRCGVVIKKYKDRFTFENPGTFRISIKEAIDGGMSDPRNAIILKMFSMIDIGERAGSGIPGVFSVWHKTFGASPEYSQRTSPDRITTTLILADYLDGFADNPVEKTGKTVEKTENTVEKTENTVEKKNSTVEKIIALIMHNPQITVKEISSLLNITRRGIEEQIKTLKSKGLIRRVGPDKGGHWEVI
ncbi:MAG: putative DNA binding domain-containing protein [Bacteroidales bacterium]|nr:putative DNA binding domain-containing protein [Bacteroidales bacterium]